MSKLLEVDTKTDLISRYGFSSEKGGAHTARTMMLEELRVLLAYVTFEGAQKSDYLQAIQEDNCLGKRSGSTRALTARHLADLYSLDPTCPIFRVLLHFWRRDEGAQPLLALLCAYGRDPVLQMSAPFIQGIPEGAPVIREALEDFIEARDPGRFRRTTLKSTAQNINATWTQSGHLKGRVKKVRVRAYATPGAAAYALFLGYLRGARGGALFRTEYARLLDCPQECAIELATEASRRGWIVFKRIGEVMEILFPNLLTPEEVEWTREPD